MVDQVLSHTLYVAIGIIALIVIISSVTDFQNNTQAIDKQVKMNYIVDQIESKILEFNSMNIDEAKIKIDGPGYLVRLENKKIIISDSDIEINRTINADVSGEAYLPAYLTYNAGKVEVV